MFASTLIFFAIWFFVAISAMLLEESVLGYT
jgi:hypothetical protein